MQNNHEQGKFLKFYLTPYNCQMFVLISEITCYIPT